MTSDSFTVVLKVLEAVQQFLASCEQGRHHAQLNSFYCLGKHRHLQCGSYTCNMRAVSASHFYTFRNNIFTATGAAKPMVLKEKNKALIMQKWIVCVSHEEKLPTHICQVAELLFECGRLLQKLH